EAAADAATEAAAEVESEEVVESSSGIYTVDDLVGKNISVQMGKKDGTFGTEVETAGTATVECYTKRNVAGMALKQGKIDCVIIDSQPAAKFVEVNDDLMILDEDFATEEYAICVAKDNTELTEAINGALAELTEEGIMDQIIANYI